jgi:hypothetical protein
MSALLSTAQTLMYQLGPVVTEIESIIQEEIDSWAIRFSDGELIHVLFQTTPSRWVLSCQLDQPAESNQAEIYAAMLCTNLLYQDVAPLKVALSEPSGVLLLIGEFQQSEGSLGELQSLIQRFRLYAENIADQICLLGEGEVKEQAMEIDASPVPAHILA